MHNFHPIFPYLWIFDNLVENCCINLRFSARAQRGAVAIYYGVPCEPPFREVGRGQRFIQISRALRVGASVSFAQSPYLSAINYVPYTQDIRNIYVRYTQDNRVINLRTPYLPPAFYLLLSAFFLDTTSLPLRYHSIITPLPSSTFSVPSPCLATCQVLGDIPPSK